MPPPIVVLAHLVRKRDWQGSPKTQRGIVIVADMRPVPSGCATFVMQHLLAPHVLSAFGKPQPRRTAMIRTTLATLALIAAAGVAHAQMQAPSTPDGRDQRSMPGATSNPNTGQPKSPMNPSAAEAAAKAQLESKGYSGVKSLTRDTAGNWAAKAMRNNVEVAVILEPSGTVREQ